MYVYRKSEPGLWTVGFYDPDGKWVPESDWDKKEDAAKRVRYLNGGNNDKTKHVSVTHKHYDCDDSGWGP